MNGFRRLLYNGGELFVNRLGSVWSVDVWDADAPKGSEPVYHAAYDNETDALADAESWKPWPNGGDES
jgi:hypothetical protein